ncbi:hypothetical protein NTE12_005301 [Vibrio harveyi]|nr:hypothetical protein [Vibrio harveyi]CAH6840122.1 conserved hypothetical protein [Vibrio chagasii]CAH7148675.1 conserved hypothetical protein [Vibrio chagasii]
MELAIELLKISCIGLVSGVFAALVALKRYKHEKWWEMRANAYRDVISALSDLTHIYDVRNRNWDASSNEPKHVHVEMLNARNQVRKLKDMGAFLFSPEAEDALVKFVDFDVDYSSVVDPGDIYGPFASISRVTLNKIVELSKKDLAISKSWL